MEYVNGGEVSEFCYIMGWSIILRNILPQFIVWVVLIIIIIIIIINVLAFEFFFDNCMLIYCQLT